MAAKKMGMRPEKSRDFTIGSERLGSDARFESLCVACLQHVGALKYPLLITSVRAASELDFSERMADEGSLIAW